MGVRYFGAAPPCSNDKDVLTMPQRLLSYIIVAVMSLFCFHHAYAEKAGSVSGSVSKGRLRDRFESDGGNGISLTKRKVKAEDTNTSHEVSNGEGKAAVDVFAGLEDKTVFVQIGEDDCLTWGAVHRYVDSQFRTKVSSLLRTAGTAADDIRLGLYKQGVARAVRSYIKAAVMARAAKMEGITVQPREFDEELKKLKAKTLALGEFEYRYMTNAVYQRAYAEKYLRKAIKISDEDVENLIKERHEANLSVPATNAMLKAQIEGIRLKLAKNEMSFGEAADEYSECPQCSADNGDCGTWEEDDSDIAPELLKVCFSLPTNVVSQVVEVPDAFHVVKITSKYVPTKKAREEDGEVSSVDVRHVQIDKWTTDPEFTVDTARDFLENRMLSRALRAKQNELINSTPIKSVIPLRDTKSKNRLRTMRFKGI